MCERQCVYVTVYVEVTEQLAEVGSLLQPFWSWGLNSDHHTGEALYLMMQEFFFMLLIRESRYKNHKHRICTYLCKHEQKYVFFFKLQKFLVSFLYPDLFLIRIIIFLIRA